MVIFNQNSDIILPMPARKARDGRGGARPGAGRPPLFKDKVRISLDLERKDHEDLEKIAERWDESVAAVIRRALNTLLKRHRR